MDMTGLYALAGLAATATALAAWHFGREGGRRERRWAPERPQGPLHGGVGEGFGKPQPQVTGPAKPAPQGAASRRRSRPSASGPASIDTAEAGGPQPLAWPAPVRRARPAPQAEAPQAGSMDRLYIGSVELVALPEAPVATGAAVPVPVSGDRAEAPPSPADEFMRWLAGSIASKEMVVNTPQSLVHVCEEGLMLAYPGIFEQYLGQEAGAEAGTAAGEERLKSLLNAVCEAGWHLRGLLNASLLQFQLHQPGELPMFLRGLVIPSPQRFVPQLPGPNPALLRLL
jgi:hypothetical protein